MRMIKTILALTVLILLLSCSEPVYRPMELTAVIENAKTTADHEALAAHYEQMARQMKMYMDEHIKRLGEYQALLPKDDEQYAQFEAHCLELIKIYAEAEQENLDLATLHRRIASRLSN